MMSQMIMMMKTPMAEGVQMLKTMTNLADGIDQRAEEILTGLKD